MVCRRQSLAVLGSLLVLLSSCGGDTRRTAHVKEETISTSAEAEFDRAVRHALCPLAARVARIERRLAEALEDPTPPSPARTRRALGRVARLLPDMATYFREVVRRERRLTPPRRLRAHWRRRIALHDTIREQAERASRRTRSGNLRSAYAFLVAYGNKQQELALIRSALQSQPCASKESAPRNATDAPP